MVTLFESRSDLLMNSKYVTLKKTPDLNKLEMKEESEADPDDESEPMNMDTEETIDDDNHIEEQEGS